MSETTDRDVRDVLMFEAGMREPRPLNAVDQGHSRLHRPQYEPRDGEGVVSEDVIPMVHAFINQRDALGTAKYGKPLTTFDGRNSIRDAQEEAGDLLNYLTKLVAEWEVVADLLEDCARYLGFNGEPSAEGYELLLRAQDTAARMRRDVARVEPASAAYRTPTERLAAMDAGGER